MSQKQIKRARKLAKLYGVVGPEPRKKRTPLPFNPDFTQARPKRLIKYENVGGRKVVKSDWVEPDIIEKLNAKKPDPIRATTVKGRKAEMRRNARRKQEQEAHKQEQEARKKHAASGSF